MKIKHKVTGKVIELMDGTKFAKSAYDLMDKDAPVAPQKTEVETATKVKDVKTKTAKQKTAKKQKAKKGDVKPEKAATVSEPAKASDVDKAQTPPSDS